MKKGQKEGREPGKDGWMRDRVKDDIGEEKGRRAKMSEKGILHRFVQHISCQGTF